MSLLQRLFERDVYAKHPAARQYRGEKKRAEEGVARDGDGQDSGFAPFAHLVQVSVLAARECRGKNVH